MDPRPLPLTKAITVGDAKVRSLTLHPPTLRAWMKHGVPYKEHRVETGSEVEVTVTASPRALAGFIAEMARITEAEASKVAAPDQEEALLILREFCGGNPPSRST